MKNVKILILLMLSLILLTGCSNEDNVYILNKLDEMEQQIVDLEKKVEDLSTTTVPVTTVNDSETPESTEKPTIIKLSEAVTMDDFYCILPSDFIYFVSTEKISDASIFMENGSYGISLSYNLDSEATQEDIKGYYQKVAGPDADINNLKNNGNICEFVTPNNDIYFIWHESIKEEQVYILSMEVHFNDADFSEILNHEDLELSKYHLDEIFTDEPTMKKIVINSNEDFEKKYCFEYKSLEEDYSKKIKFVYDSYNFDLSDENEREISYRLSDNGMVFFKLDDNSNRIDVHIIYFE